MTVLPTLDASPLPATGFYDAGYGTTFERLALNRQLLRLHTVCGLQSILEGPDDGMTGIYGINSLVLGRLGLPVDLVVPDAARAETIRRVWRRYADPGCLKIHVSDSGLNGLDGQWDLVWNFNVMTRTPEPDALLERMCALSRRWVLLVVPNAANYSFPLHRLHHRVAKEAWDHGPVELMRPQAWQNRFQRLGLTVRETFYLDCPWWPDIVDPGQLIADFFPFLKAVARQARPQNRYLWAGDHLPYYALDQHPDLQRWFDRLAIFENSRFNGIKKTFGHHIAILAEL
jgi:hypothetical protein